MSSLPEELIFLVLPVKSLLACKCVCKNWFTIISDPTFVKMHLYFTIQNNDPKFMLGGPREPWYGCIFNSIGYDAILSRMYDEFDFSVFSMDYLPFKYTRLSDIGVCNGLVCIWSRQSTCLWNPATTEYKVIPKSSSAYANKKSVIRAFGYDDKTCDYKVVNVYGDEDVFSAAVYTLGSNSWESIQIEPYSFRYQPKIGVLVNGAFHWLGKMSNCSVIVSLDASDKEFKHLQLPKEKKDSFRCVAVLEGCLCVLVGVKFDLEVWVLQDYGVQESWTKRYTITDMSRSMRSMLSFNYGEILLLPSSDIISHDPKHGSAGEPSDLNLFFYGRVNYVESLASLNSSTYMQAGKYRN